MAFFSYGKRVKPKKFDYIPMHYDAAKEELESRMAQYGQSDVSDSELAKARIRSGIRLKARGESRSLARWKKRGQYSFIYYYDVVGCCILLLHPVRGIQCVH